MDWSYTLFYIVFISQILLLSWYLPKKLLARMQHVLETYPPAMYPKLYPKPVEHYRMAHLLFKYVNRFIMLLGYLILLALMFWVDHSTFADDGFISEAWPAAYGMLQFLPLIAVELSEFSNLREMRQANTASRRVASLQRRGLTNLLSPALFGAAVLLFIGAIVFDLYVNDFAVTWGHDSVQRAIVMSVTNGLLAAVGLWSLYGRKQDPHQSTEDRAHNIAVNLKSLLFVSMALSVFNMMSAADNLVEMKALEAVLVSIYFQAIALLSLGYVLKNVKTEDLNFDVYKEDPATT